MRQKSHKLQALIACNYRTNARVGQDPDASKPTAIDKLERPWDFEFTFREHIEEIHFFIGLLEYAGGREDITCHRSMCSNYGKCLRFHFEHIKEAMKGTLLPDPLPLGLGCAWDSLGKEGDA